METETEMKMEMEGKKIDESHSPPTEFIFDSACTSPYISAPSSPQRFGNFFFSAPTSPTRVSPFYHHFHGGDADTSWEHTPKSNEPNISTPASSNYGDAADEDLEDIEFAFDFSGISVGPPLTADELFDGGKIKPLRPIPKFLYDPRKSVDSPKKKIREAFSPGRRSKKYDSDPFAAALEEIRRESVHENANEERGRERTMNSSGSRSKNSRSLSPLRVSDLLFEPEPDPNQEPTKNSNTSLFSSISFASFWYNKKWKIKDLLLFRSASESRATDQEQLKKHNMLKKTRQDDVKNSSFRSTDSAGSSSVSSKTRSGAAQISAHEFHYTVNRAFSEEMKKRTSLPYKQGLLGCLGFHPTASKISKVLSPNGSLSRG